MSQPREAEPPVRAARSAVFLRRTFHDLRTEGRGTRHETGAIAAGVFIGCLPVYGFHLALCWVVGRLLGLNRLKLYLAANISNPIVAPFLLFAELQFGSWLRRGSFHPMTLDAVRAAGAVELGLDLLLGSVVLGAALAALAAWGTYATLRGSEGDRPFIDLVQRAANRYVTMSITAWEFARGKLRHDPVYRAAVYDGLLLPSSAAIPQTTTLVDVGCGQGLMLALLAEVRRDVHAGVWRGAAAAPVFARMVGVETRAGVAAIAQQALAGDAEILTADARTTPMPPCDVVLLFDVLHLMPARDQEALLDAVVGALAPGGVLVVREADASAGWKFQAVRAGNRLKALAIGRWRQSFHFRTATEWRACLARFGLQVQQQPMGAGTPFGNVLFRAGAPVHAVRPAAPASAPTSPPAPLA